MLNCTKTKKSAGGMVKSCLGTILLEYPSFPGVHSLHSRLPPYGPPKGKPESAKFSLESRAHEADDLSSLFEQLRV